MKKKESGSMRRNRLIGDTITYIILILISIIWLFPFFGLIMQSFRSYESRRGIRRHGGLYHSETFLAG